MAFLKLISTFQKTVYVNIDKIAYFEERFRGSTSIRFTDGTSIEVAYDDDELMRMIEEI